MTNRSVPVCTQATSEALTRALVQAYVEGMNYVAGLPEQTVVILGLTKEPTARYIFSPRHPVPEEIRTPLHRVPSIRSTKVVDEVLRLAYDPIYGLMACLLPTLDSVSALLGFTGPITVVCAGAFGHEDAGNFLHLGRGNSNVRRSSISLRNVPVFTYQR